jgi:hypothetical protein
MANIKNLKTLRSSKDGEWLAGKKKRYTLKKKTKNRMFSLICGH